MLEKFTAWAELEEDVEEELVFEDIDEVDDAVVVHLLVDANFVRETGFEVVLFEADAFDYFACVIFARWAVKSELDETESAFANCAADFVLADRLWDWVLKGLGDWSEIFFGILFFELLDAWDFGVGRGADLATGRRKNLGCVRDPACSRGHRNVNVSLGNFLRIANIFTLGQVRQPRPDQRR